MGKATFILVLGSLALFSIYVANMNNYVMKGSLVMYDRYSTIQAKQLANSVVNILLSDLAEDPGFRTADGEISLLDGDATYRVIDTLLFSPDSLILIDVTATYGYGYGDTEKTYTVKAFTTKPGGWVPPSIRGAWTANADLNNTISDMFIDGRDHNLDGTINPTTGNFAISSASNFTNVDNASIGGTYLGVDFPMTFPHNPLVIEQNVDWGESFPRTPDEILGYPEGTLMSIAKSGADGSQYVLNPGDKIDENDLTFPLSGVTYVEITNGMEAKYKSATDDPDLYDEGILIFHAPDGSSRIKEVSSAKGAENPFVGLLISDYSFHHHIDIIGAVLQLSNKLEDEKNCNGNADHYVYYSSDSIIGATKLVAEEMGSEGNYGVGGQIGTGRKKVLFWYE